MSPASKEHKLQKIFTFGRRSYTLTINVPMCDTHFQSASFKGTAEKLVARFGIIMGVIAGLFSTITLLVYWQQTGQGNTFLNFIPASVLGLGIFLILWAILSLSVAPLFAEAASKEARRAVRITRYWPKDQFVRLKFQNEHLAAMVRSIN
jgi:hypothetical protein